MLQDSPAPPLAAGPETEDPTYDHMMLLTEVF